jgi:hypothetical protein
MAPPERDFLPRDQTPLNDAGISNDCRGEAAELWHNAAHVCSWVEWLLHPEEHQYDRTVIWGTGKREEPGPVLGQDSESVIAGYEPWQFLHGLEVVSTQVVKDPSSLLGVGAVALDNVWTFGNQGIQDLITAFGNVTWKGGSRVVADGFIGQLGSAVTEVNKLMSKPGGDVMLVTAKYAAIITATRKNLDEAADALVRAFDRKFAEKPEEGIDVDWKGALLSGIAAAATVVMTSGASAPIAASAAAEVWAELFKDAAGDLVKEKDDSMSGYWWRELAQAYFHKQTEIMQAAARQMDELNDILYFAIQEFDQNKEIQDIVQKNYTLR